MPEDKAPLLGELEELKAVLREQRGVDLAAIPLLDDIIENETSPEFADIDLASGNTFDEEYLSIADEPIHDDSHIDDDDSETPADNAASPYADDGNFEREIFMQEVIDSMMPEIEAELRSRLLGLDESILARWHAQLHTKK
ncbi:hypothetical protein [Zhongshania marina]|uniref:Uncharacterized protein n=1 Tax=Zhongshania marina TaxID=2304603 RepID=A0A2S4HIF6_9GAMM|nr:hypothetical protein [Marortus luteolus]POP53739.1 hypothetical protein C0068_05565 [Marortus luteolus]